MKGKRKIPDRLSGWVEAGEASEDIIISSRVRLARNLGDYPFPNQAEKEDLFGVREEIASALEGCNDELDSYNMEELTPLEKEALIERHLISRAHSGSSRPCATHINSEQTLSIMVNEEDHLRMQFIDAGDKLDTLWERADSLDDLLEKNVDYAFSDEIGYLTACPTNVGTGMRASVMMHLPGLTMRDSIEKLLGGVGKFGLTVRGIFGEGTGAEGSIYQLSNQVTLGLSEEDILENLHSILSQVIAEEKRARQKLLAENEYEIKDKIMRAFGILKNGYKINNLEAVHFLSLLLLGNYYGLFKELTQKKILQLLITTRPAHLQLFFDEKMDPTRRDVLRASFLRDELAEF